MHPEPTAADIEGVARRDKSTFQRLAIDLLRLTVAGGAVIRGFDLGPGRKDFGFDAEIEGAFRRLSGRIRVSAKGNLAWADLRRDAADDARRHAELPLLLLAALPLDVHKIALLKKDALAAGVPAFEVVDGSTLAEWLRDAPHLERLYLRGADCALVPVEQACVRFAPRASGRAEGGPWLASEEAAADAVLARWRAGTRVVFMQYAPDTRPERCMWKVARDLAGEPCGEALTWARTDGTAPMPADAWMSPAFARRPHTFIAPWGAGALDLVRWWCELPEPAGGKHRILLAVPLGEEDEVRYELGVRGREVGKPEAVELKLPRDAHELDPLASWLLPNTHSRVRREAFCEVYGLRPALMELGAQDAHLLATRGQRAFPDAGDLGALALVAVVGAWPPRPPIQEWMLDWLGRDVTAVDAMVHRGRHEGWLDARSDVHTPSSRASRWALVHGWKSRDTAGWSRFVRGLRTAPMEVLAVLLPGLAEVEQYAEVESYLLDDLAAETWHLWGSQLATLATSSERVHERVLVLAERALKAGSCPVGLQAISDIVLVTPRFPRNVVRALRVCALLRRAGHSSPYGNRTPEGIVKDIVNPHRLPAPMARRALEWVPDAFRRGEIGVEEAEALVAPWLREGVGVEESSGTSFSFGTSGWNPKNPELPGCWRAAAAVVLALLSSPGAIGRAAGWRLVDSAGAEVSLGPRPRDMRAPDALVAVVTDLVRDSLDHLPPAVDWSPRHEAERALLHVTERSFIPGSLATEALSRFSRDPVFRAWELCVDRNSAFPDPDAYMRTRASAGVMAARRERIESSHHEEGARTLGARLSESGCDAEELMRLLNGIATTLRASSSGWRGFDTLRAWAEKAPAVFEDVVLGPTWGHVPREVRAGLLWATAPVFAARLSGAALVRATPKGAAADMARLLSSPAGTAAEEAIALLPAMELATPPNDAPATLRTLAAHPHPQVRQMLATWVYRLVLRGEHDYPALRDVVLHLCRCPGGLPAMEAHLMLTRRKDRQRELLLEEDLTRAFQDHVDAEPDEAAWRFVVSNEYSLRPLIWETFMRSPERWWRFAVDRVDEHLRFSNADDLMEGMPPEVEPHHIADALRQFPFPLELPYDRREKQVRALVGRLPDDAFTSLTRALLDEGRDDDARSLVVCAGAKAALARVIAQVGARFDDEVALGDWAGRVAWGGARRWHGSAASADDEAGGSGSPGAVEAFRGAAREVGGREGHVLDLVADAL